MTLSRIAEKFVLGKLKKIYCGNLKLINYDGKVFHFGNLEDKLIADIKINNQKFFACFFNYIYITRSTYKLTFI